MSDPIKRNGFTFRRPCGVPAKADPDERREFVAKCEEIQANLGDSDQIVFMDGVRPSHAVRFARGWIRKGARKEMKANAGQRRLNVLGALNLATMQLFAKEYATPNAEAVVAFFAFLLGSMPRGLIHVVLEQGKYQRLLTSA